MISPCRRLKLEKLLLNRETGNWRWQRSLGSGYDNKETILFWRRNGVESANSSGMSCEVVLLISFSHTYHQHSPITASIWSNIVNILILFGEWGGGYTNLVVRKPLYRASAKEAAYVVGSILNYVMHGASSPIWVQLKKKQLKPSWRSFLKNFTSWKWNLEYERKTQIEHSFTHSLISSLNQKY